MINQLARYLPVLHELRDAAEPILEVGCGAAGIGRWTRLPFVGCDRSFTDYGTADVDRSGPMRPVVGDATRLPFRDGAFGAVLCLDTLEHLPPAGRMKVVREICRVARGRVILAFPWGRGVSTWDRRLAAFLRRTGREIPTWLSEHLAVEPPDRGQVKEELRACGFLVRERGAAPAVAHFLLMCAESRPRLGRGLASLSTRISLALTGRPRHRIDRYLARTAEALYPAVSRLTGSRRGYRAYLVADPLAASGRSPARESDDGRPVGRNSG